MPRKTTGCWTCRARKKKCDSTQPVCLSCTFRGIACYGFSTKPEWIDGAVREREMLRVIELQCKASYQQRRSRQAKLRGRSLLRDPLPFQQNQAKNDQAQAISNTLSIPGQPIEPDGSQHLASEIDNQLSGLLLMHDDHHMPSDASVESESVLSPENLTSPAGRVTEKQLFYSDTELNLVMHYLDHIFPRLCPFFKYTPTDDGRGWLLNLFLRTKPLCALAICISACDKAQLVLGALNETPQPHHDLENRRIQIHSDTRVHIGRLMDQNGAYQMAAAVEALACIMHLILFELWIPRKDDMDNDWILHIDAATMLLQSVAKNPTGLSSQIMANGRIEDHFPTEDLSQSQLAAFDYNFTLYTYYYISTHATFDLMAECRLSLDRTFSIFHDRQCKLRNAIGCEDWVMTTILDIVILRKWKLRMQSSNAPIAIGLAQRGARIEKRLTEGLMALASSRTSVKSFYEQQQDMVTNIFINGALVFLHAVKSGFYPNLREIQCSVLQTLEALEYMRQYSTINIPSWPYCVAGSLAMEFLHPRFRALYPQPMRGTHPLVNTKWTLDVMQESWSLRHTQPEDAEICHWGRAMTNLRTRILLA